MRSSHRGGRHRGHAEAPLIAAWAIAAALLFAIPARPEQPRGGGICGNGDLEGDEQCDDGAFNGNSECGCQVDCTFVAFGVECGDQNTNDCVDESCDGAGVCVPTFNAEGTFCGDQSATACDSPDTCDAVGVCLTNHAEEETPCEDDGLFCSGAGSCQEGLCVSLGPPCGPSQICDEEQDVCGPSLAQIDVDGDGEVQALTDGLLILRYAFGLRGAVLINGAVDTQNCARCTAAEIEAYVAGLVTPQ